MTETELRAALAELSAALDAKGLGYEHGGACCDSRHLGGRAYVFLWLHYLDTKSRRPVAQYFEATDFASAIAAARAWIAAQPGLAAEQPAPEAA